MPSTLTRSISPPRRVYKRRKTSENQHLINKQDDASRPSPVVTTEPTLAAVEAGRAKVDDHVSYFKTRLSGACRPATEEAPRISIEDWASLYERNEHEHGNHFVIHQHNHPVSGVHYDLRLQFSKSSSMSFAVPKGLPGDPNSKSLGRMAIETRVHNLWNHLIESASARTGSLLIWDTGTYTVLPRKSATRKPPSPQTTDDDSDADPEDGAIQPWNAQPENRKLVDAFHSRYIRLRLHGTRLPKEYTITLRLPSANDFGKPHQVRRRHRRKPKPINAPQSSDSDADVTDARNTTQAEAQRDLDTDSDEDAQTRLTNAYPGSTNTIGSVHQRHWFMLLDRASSGFVRSEETGQWVRNGGEGFAPFYVRGRDFETSVVTGRLAREVERDEGVDGLVGRNGWVGITR